jgi:hypothetical protein
LRDDCTDGVPDRRILKPHAGHGVYLEAAAEDVAAKSVSVSRSPSALSDARVVAYKGYVILCAVAPAIAPAASLPTAPGFFSPSGVIY